MPAAVGPGAVGGRWMGPAFWLLLVAWAALGAAHTGGSYLTNGLSPSEPVAVGVPVEDWGDDLRVVHGLLAERPGRRIFVQLAPSADTTQVLYLRYQLAHLLYPREVYGGRAVPEPRAAPSGVGYDVVVTGPGAPAPPARRRAESRGGYTLWLEAP